MVYIPNSTWNIYKLYQCITTIINICLWFKCLSLLELVNLTFYINYSFLAVSQTSPVLIRKLLMSQPPWVPTSVIDAITMFACETFPMHKLYKLCRCQSVTAICSLFEYYWQIKGAGPIIYCFVRETERDRVLIQTKQAYKTDANRIQTHRVIDSIRIEENSPSRLLPNDTNIWMLTKKAKQVWWCECIIHTLLHSICPSPQLPGTSLI